MAKDIDRKGKVMAKATDGKGEGADPDGQRIQPPVIRASERHVDMPLIACYDSGHIAMQESCPVHAQIAAQKYTWHNLERP